MSEYGNEWDDNDADEGRSDNPIKALRKIEREQKATIKELQEQLSTMKAEVRQQSVKDVLAQNGLSDKIAKFIPDDITSAEDVSAWVSENAEIFGSPVPEPTDGGEETTDPSADAAQRIAASQAGGATASGDAGQMEALIAAASSPEDLNRILFGNPTGPSVV
jgi:TolA-binding protein